MVFMGYEVIMGFVQNKNIVLFSITFLRTNKGLILNKFSNLLGIGLPGMETFEF